MKPIDPVGGGAGALKKKDTSTATEKPKGNDKSTETPGSQDTNTVAQPVSKAPTVSAKSVVVAQAQTVRETASLSTRGDGEITARRNAEIALDRMRLNIIVERLAEIASGAFIQEPEDRDPDRLIDVLNPERTNQKPAGTVIEPLDRKL